MLTQEAKERLGVAWEGQEMARKEGRQVAVDETGVMVTPAPWRGRLHGAVSVGEARREER